MIAYPTLSGSRRRRATPSSSSELLSLQSNGTHKCSSSAVETRWRIHRCVAFDLSRRAHSWRTDGTTTTTTTTTTRPIVPGRLAGPSHYGHSAVARHQQRSLSLSPAGSVALCRPPLFLPAVHCVLWPAGPLFNATAPLAVHSSLLPLQRLSKHSRNEAKVKHFD